MKIITQTLLIVVLLQLLLITCSRDKQGIIPMEKPDKGFIQNWLICGPFTDSSLKTDEGGEHPAYHQDFFKDCGGEKNITPAAGLACRYKDSTYKWIKYTSDSFHVNFEDVIPLKFYSAAYAYCEIDAPEDMEGFISLGSDDGVKIWLNHKLVYTNYVFREVTPDEDMVKVKVKKGKNKLLLKVFNGEEGTGFCVRTGFNAKDKLNILFREKLTVAQDRHVVTPGDADVNFRVHAQGTDPNLYSANLVFSIEGPGGKTKKIKKAYEPDRDISVTIPTEHEGLCRITLTVEDAAKGRSTFRQSVYCLPKLETDNKITKQLITDLELRVMTLNRIPFDRLQEDPVPDSVNKEIRKSVTREIKMIVEGIKTGNHVFKHKKGKYARALRSEIDNDLVPYMLYIPPSYDPEKKNPLHVIVHGTWEGLTKEKFVTYHSLRPESPGTEFNMVKLWVFGRGNTEFHGLGEKIVFEVMDHVKRQYAIDESRQYLSGFSMGGHAAWFLSLYNQHEFAAISPVSGYNGWYVKDDKLKPWEKPDAYAYKAIHHFTENWKHVPQFIIHGNEDEVVYAKNSRFMVEKLTALGYEHRYKEVPGADHNYTIADEREQNKWFLKYKINPFPEEVVFSTAGLRHNRSYWVTIDEFRKYGKTARIRAVRKGSSGIAVKTENIRRFSLDLKGFQKLKKPLRISIDKSPAVTAGPDGFNTFVFADKTGQWQIAEGGPKGLCKKHGLQGTMKDVYYDHFIYVYGTAGSAKETRINRRVAFKERDNLIGTMYHQVLGNFPVKADTEVTEEDIRHSNLILVGRPASNRLTDKIRKSLPITLTGETVRAKKTHSEKDLIVRFIYPNPMNTEKYVVVFYAVDPASLKPDNGTRDFMPDYAVYSAEYRKDGSLEKEYREAGIFNGNWKL